MKKLRRITLLVTALSLTAGSMVSTAANAECSLWCIERSSEEYAAQMEGYTLFDDYSGLFYSWGYYPPREDAPEYRVFANESGSAFIYETFERNAFTFTLKEVSDFEGTDAEIAQLIADYDPTYYYYSNLNDDGFYTYTVYTREQSDKNLYDARNICEDLRSQDMISEFYYGKNYNEWTIIYADLLKYSGDKKESLEEYVAENNLDCEVVSFLEESGTTSYERCCIEPNYEMTLEEKVALAKQISDDLGYSAWLLSPEIAYPPFADIIDLYNLNYGDVDNDGAVNALDASNILTYYASGQTGSLSTYSDEDIDSMTLVGDYDGDGNVNAVDASLVLAEYAEEQTKQ